MIYLLCGQDGYRLSQKLDEIIDEYSAKCGSFLDITRIDLQEESEQLFWDALNQANLFSSKKFLIIKNSFLNPVFKKAILKKIKNLAKSQDILIFIENQEIKPADPFFLALKENGQVQNFSILTGVRLRNWVKNYFEQLHSSIDEAAIDKLLEYTNNNTWALANEIKKLFAFGNSITKKEVELLVKPKFEAEIFKTLDCFFAKNKKAALKELQKHLDLGESHFYLLSMIGYQIRNLLLVKIAQASNNLIVQGLGLHPFVLKKLLVLISGFSLEKLKNDFNNLFSADLKIKTGQDSPEGIIKSLVISL